jgi:diguanylate cyclase (GGDEF)-like protein
MTASFGVASFPDDGKDISALIRAADRALYSAKANGRNRVERA